MHVGTNIFFVLIYIIIAYLIAFLSSSVPTAETKRKAKSHNGKFSFFQISVNNKFTGGLRCFIIKDPIPYQRQYGCPTSRIVPSYSSVIQNGTDGIPSS